MHDSEFSSSLKDMIEALGVPHTEIDLLLVNGIPSPLSQLVHEGKRVATPFLTSHRRPVRFRRRADRGDRWEWEILPA